MNFKNLKIGSKLGFGFGILILISVALGAIAIVNMMNIRKSATYLAEEYAPEVKIGNNVERFSLLAMYANRGYGFTEEERFLLEGKENIAKVKNHLEEAKELSRNSEALKKLEGLAQTAEEGLNKYESLLNETVDVNQALIQERAEMDKAAQNYMLAAYNYLEAQNSAMSREISSRSTEQSRLKKISVINSVIDLGNATRITNFKSQVTRDPELFRSALNNFPEIDHLFDELRQYTRSEADLKSIDNVQTASNNYKTAMENFLTNWLKREDINRQRDEAGREVLAAAKNTAMAGVDGTQEISNQAIGIINRSSSVMVFGLIFALLIGVFFAVVIAKAITGPINKGVKFAQTIAAGDLTATVDVNQKDEIGVLAETLKNMVAKLRDIVGNVKGGAENITSASVQMSSSSQQMSQGASEQAASAEEVSSSMEEMAANIQQNTDNAQQTETIALKAAKDVMEGSKAVNQTVISMKNIAEKIKIIGEIARQTNILALNAAVEAARAGEHGKGFAVVAAEVRKLAERSQSAAAEIDDVSRSSVDIAEKSGKLLEEIVPDIQKTAKLVQEISAASIEQNSGSNQVNAAIQELNKVTQQNAASAEEMATSSEELSSQAESLLDTITYFKVDNNVTKISTRKNIIAKKQNKTTQPVKQKEVSQNGHSNGKGFELLMNGDQANDNDYEKF